MRKDDKEKLEKILCDHWFDFLVVPKVTAAFSFIEWLLDDDDQQEEEEEE